MRLRYRNILKILLITGGVAMLTFLHVFGQEDDRAQVIDRIEVIKQSNTDPLPEVGGGRSRSGSISDVLRRLFDSRGKIKSVFISAFDNLSIGALPLWNGNRFVDSFATVSGSTINFEGDLTIEGDLYADITSDSVSDNLWSPSGSDIYYSQTGTTNVGIGILNPQATLDVNGSVILGNTADACGSSKIGTIRFNSGSIEYCSFIDYVWVESPWSEWTETCGSATRSKTVTCQDPSGNVSPASCDPGEKPASSESSVQGSSTCGWTDWTDWSETCGSATRERTCTTGAPGSANCAGSDTESSIQGSSTCGWSNYGDWSTTCGNATRTRTCSTGSAGSANCSGSATESSVQGSSTCGWGPWDNWSTNCGNATRERTCNTGAAGSTHCSGSATQSSVQGSSTCGWSSWSSWSTCSKTCGGGTQSRSRSCNEGSAGGAFCSGGSTESRSCNTGACYTGNWSTPGAAPACTTACGNSAYTAYGSSSTCQGPGPCNPATKPSRNSRYCAATAACPSNCTFFRPYAWTVNGNTCIESGGNRTTTLAAGATQTVSANSNGTFGSATVKCVNGNIVHQSGTCRAGQIQ